VAGPNWEIGQVATARNAGDGTWRTGPDDVVIGSPPSELQLRAFRDPFVFRREGDWALLMAAALPDGSGGVLQYTSPDLKRWTYDGLLCSRSTAGGDGLNTGGLWECPQLFPIGDRWVLVVSVWDEGDLLYVAAAVGDYDGRTFEPAGWQRLTYGASAYAGTAFLDKEGRRCLLSWLREEPHDTPSLARRAGAHSVASTVALDAEGIVVLAPHPAVDGLRSSPLTGNAADGRVQYAVNDTPVDVSTAVSGGLWCEIAEPERWRARLYYDEERHGILVHRPELPVQQLPLPPGDDLRVRALLDADILEIFTAGTYGAFRIPPAADPARTSCSSPPPTRRPPSDP
jgi:beta-fructofuranosidase